MASAEERLLDEMAKCAKDLLRFVKVSFPWGERNTILADQQGPDEWQAELLETIGRLLGQSTSAITVEEAIRVAIGSGHGVGKSCIVAWVILWAMSTRPDTKGIVTANTMPQLMTKTWPELAKWYNLLICKHWFKLTATRLSSKDPTREETWRVDAVPWNETNTEAFAGLHNQGRRILVIYDEASAVDDKIWEVTEGALTDAKTEIIWCTFGNPTRNTGRFRDCFGRLKHRWITRQIDSRSVKITNKPQIAQWIADYGEDSDFVRVRVRGVFPRAGTMQFIGTDLVEAAAAREPTPTIYDPLAIGVDVARYGDDATVIWFRKGRDARSIDPVVMRGASNMEVANRVNQLILYWQPQGVFVDGTGTGSGVVDRLRELGHRNIHDINFGGKAGTGFIKEEGAVAYANKRAEMWGAMRDWLGHGAIPNDPDLIKDLTGVEYGYAMREGRDAILLEKKDDMKRRGLASPDRADALALSFAVPLPQGDYGRQSFQKPVHEVDYEPFADAYAGIGKQPAAKEGWMPGRR